MCVYYIYVRGEKTNNEKKHNIHNKHIMTIKLRHEENERNIFLEHITITVMSREHIIQILCDCHWLKLSHKN